MKYTISGFSQKGMIELGLSADDLNILRWFIDFKDSGGMIKEYCVEEDCFYYWVKYDALIEALPYLFADNKTEDAKKKKVQRLFNGNLSKVLKKRLTKKTSGTYTFFALIEETYKGLLDSTGQSKAPNVGLEGCTGQDLSGGHRSESVQPKDSSINDSSINNKATDKNEVVERLWKLYPRKQGKFTEAKVMKVIKEIGEDHLERCIIRYAEECKKENKEKRFILMGSTFINGRYIEYTDENYNEDKEHLKRKDIPSFNANTNYKASANIDEGYGF